jgi:tetratricopeptide (TPR) repeat protein
MSLVYSRLAESRKAERLASEALEMAERLGQKRLVAEAAVRVGSCFLHDAPARALTQLDRALSIYESLGDIRGQAIAENARAIAIKNEGRVIEAQDAFEGAIATARVAGMPDMAGVAALNYGALILRGGDFVGAGRMFGEAMTAFATVRNSQHQLIALFNLAHAEREQGLWTSAIGLFGTAVSLAQRIGQGEVEILSLAGQGLCNLETGDYPAAATAATDVIARLNRRPEWFQNREIAEALAVRWLAHEGRVPEAFDRFAAALALNPGEEFTAVWLAGECGRSLLDADYERARLELAPFEVRAKALGSEALARRIAELSSVS